MIASARSQINKYITRCLAIIVLFLASFSSTVQGNESIGHLKLINCKIDRTEIADDTICGQPIKMKQLTITAKTKVQMSCHYGDPSKNKYETIKNKILISYTIDSSGSLRDSMLAEIKAYRDEQEEWAKKNNSGSDFSFLPYNKSFFINKSEVIPFIKTDSENPGDYQLFYLNKQLYKIELRESNGLGCLSLFVSQNMEFTKNGEVIQFGEYIRDLDKVKKILDGFR